MKYILTTFIASLLISYTAAAQRAAETIPAFTFYKLDKSAFTINNLQPGKMSFFIFFDATCDHCQRAVQTLNKRYGELKNTNVYMVTLDNRETIDRFMNKYGQALNGKKNVTLLQDLHNEFISKFGPRKYPSIFLYSPAKKLMLYDDNEENMFRFFQQISTAAK